MSFRCPYYGEDSKLYHRCGSCTDHPTPVRANSVFEQIPVLNAVRAFAEVGLSTAVF
jgi:hypothetical protein